MSISGSGDIDLVQIDVTWKSLVLFGGIWLPVVVKAFSVFGGSVETDAGMIQVKGALPTFLQNLDTLASVRGRLGLSEEIQAELDQAIRSTEEVVSASFATSSSAREKLRSLTKEYERIRKNVAKEDGRTYKLEGVVAKIRAVSGAAGFSDTDLRSMYRSGSPGWVPNFLYHQAG